MDIIDSEGRLFGRVNIIDALVVLLVAAVLAAGIALVAGSGGSSGPDSPVSAEFATLTIGPVSDETATVLAETDSLSLVEGERTLNVTDVVRTPHPSRDAALVLVRVRVPIGTASNSLSERVPVSTGQFRYNATVDSLGNRSTIDVRETAVTLETTVSEEVAAAVTRGDTFSVGDESVATVTGVQRLGTDDNNRRLRVSLDLQVANIDGTDRFARRSIRLGSSLPFRTEAYSFTGRIVSRNRTIQDQQNLTVRTESVVSDTVAASIEAGDEYRLGGQTVAEIETVSAYPVADTGRQRLVTTMELRTIVADGRPMFLGQAVRVGTTVPFDTSSYRFDATVLAVNASGPRQSTDVTLDIAWDNVSPALSDAVTPGMAEQHRGASTTITDVEREPATVVIESESGEIFARDHPVNEDVRLTVSARADRQQGRLSFHGERVQTGDSVVLDFGTVTVRGTVVGVTADG
jgi:hypothetical protein